MSDDPFSCGLAVLVVEDDEDLREALRDVMAMDGYAVDAASTLSDASTMMAKRKPAVMILDLMLHDERSEPLLAALQAAGADAPVAVLVSAARDAKAVAERYGVPFLAKPFDVEELSTLVAGEVARKSVPTA